MTEVIFSRHRADYEPVEGPVRQREHVPRIGEEPRQFLWATEAPLVAIMEEPALLVAR